MTSANVELARQGFDAALRGDLDAIAELLAPDVSWHGGDPDAEGACHDREQALSFMRASELIAGGRFELVDIVGAGDRVVVIIQPPGRSSPVANVATFRDGKVVEMVHYADAADALAAARR